MTGGNFRSLIDPDLGRSLRHRAANPPDLDRTSRDLGASSQLLRRAAPQFGDRVIA